jgi:hypothetical protein
MSLSSFEAECESRGIDVSLASAVRTSVAKVIKVDPEDLHFATPTIEILRQAGKARWDGWDDAYFVFDFEELTGLTIPDGFELPRIAPARFFFWKTEGATTLGEWCENVVRELTALRH